MTFLISAGHGNRDSGAVNGDWIEHLEAYKITWFLRSALESKGHAVDFVSCFQSLSEKIEKVNRRAAESTIAAAVEIHFNSAESKDAHGTEVLYVSDKALPVATNVSQTLSAAIGTTDRGAKKRTNLVWLTGTKPMALIVEVLFLSSVLDTSAIDRTFHRRAAEAIAEGLINAV